MCVCVWRGLAQGPTELCLFWVNGLTLIEKGGSRLERVCLEKLMAEIKKRNGVIFKEETRRCCVQLQRNKEGLFPTIISARAKMFHDKQSLYT